MCCSAARLPCVQLSENLVRVRPTSRVESIRFEINCTFSLDPTKYFCLLALINKYFYVDSDIH